MTAAKKLKKLEARLSPAGLAGLVETVDSYEAKKELAGVLPQIVAVIEAAETVGQWPPENRYDYPPLRAALAALDEALA